MNDDADESPRGEAHQRESLLLASTVEARGRRFEHIARSAPDYFLQLDRDGVILYMNRPAPGHTLTDMIGSNVRRWMEPSAHASFERALAAVFETGRLHSYESIGSVSGRHYENRIAPIADDRGVGSAFLVTHDITDRVLAEEQLRESEERFRALVEGGFEGLMISIDGVVAIANSAIARMLRCPADAIIGCSPRDFCTPESVPLVIEAIRTGREAPYDVTLVRQDGTTFPCEVLGRNILYQGKRARLAAFRDVTERHRLEQERALFEEKIQNAQKLESLGVLAGSIAHDFGTVLTAVLTHAELALSQANQASASRLREICDAALRGRELTRQLLAYASRGPQEREPIALDELVRDTLPLCEVSLSKKVQLSLSFGAGAARVLGDRSQLRQVILNLVMNASEACGDREGSLRVQSQLAEVTTDELSDAYLQPLRPLGQALVLRVTDDGAGMGAATMARMFDPFFSTKQTGRGLGLASVLSIVRGHAGAVRVRSAEGRGTEVVVWLPALDATARTDLPADEPESGARTSPLVLVADDEPMLRLSTRDLLQSLGFDVVLAVDGLEALELFEARRDEFDLLFLDLTMPRLSGVEALRRVRTEGSSIPVICTSGFGVDDLEGTLATDPNTHFLPKPYAILELVAVLEAALRRPLSVP